MVPADVLIELTSHFIPNYSALPASLVFIPLGSAASFLVARLLLRPVIRNIVIHNFKAARYCDRAISSMVSPSSGSAAWILFPLSLLILARIASPLSVGLINGPFCYLIGATTSMRFLPFSIVNSLAMAPAILLYAFTGADRSYSFDDIIFYRAFLLLKGSFLKGNVVLARLLFFGGSIFSLALVSLVFFVATALIVRKALAKDREVELRKRDSREFEQRARDQYVSFLPEDIPPWATDTATTTSNTDDYSDSFSEQNMSLGNTKDFGTTDEEDDFAKIKDEEENDMFIAPGSTTKRPHFKKQLAKPSSSSALLENENYEEFYGNTVYNTVPEKYLQAKHKIQFVSDDRNNAGSNEAEIAAESDDARLHITPDDGNIFSPQQAEFILRHKSTIGRSVFVSPSTGPFALRVFSPRLAPNTKKLGMLFLIRGNKMSDFSIKQAKLYLEGERFWNALKEIYGAATVAAAKVLMHPMNLCDSMMSRKAFSKGITDVEAEIQFGTGLNGSISIRQSTLKRTLLKIVRYGDPEFTLRVEYKSGSGKKGTLLEVSMRASSLLESNGENWVQL